MEVLGEEGGDVEEARGVVEGLGQGHLGGRSGMWLERYRLCLGCQSPWTLHWRASRSTHADTWRREFARVRTAAARWLGCSWPCQGASRLRSRIALQGWRCVRVWKGR